MKVLITGSNGLVGTALKQALDTANISYDVVERASSSPHVFEKIGAPLNGPCTYRINWPSGLSQLPYSDYSTVIHLALPRPKPQEPPDVLIKEQIEALQLIVAGINQGGARCSLLFLSSQSASPEALSSYGRGKWQCEQILYHSSIPWTVVRPGLIMSDSPKGLGGAIKNLLRWAPVVPVPSGSSMRVQPVLLTDIIEACMVILLRPSDHLGRCYDLALPPRSLVSFAREICSSLGLKRIIFPIPWKVISGLLRVSEYLPIQLPVSRGNLEGLLASREMNSQDAALALNIQLNNCSSPPTPEKRLTSEAQCLFMAMFGAEAPPEVIVRYITAQTEHLLNGAWINMSSIVNQGLDIEAIEFASRRRRTILSQKMYIMCYVAEQSPALLPQFINSQTCRLRAFTELGIAGVRSAWKLVYGTYLIRRFNLLSREPHD